VTELVNQLLEFYPIDVVFVELLSHVVTGKV
jgi:hypothetical protein